MSIKKDLTGNRFGKLEVLEFKGKANDGHSKWLCKCDCGKTTIVTSNNLRPGGTLSCGCSRRGQSGKDETGKRYGYLVVVKRTHNVDGKWAFLCKCDCGNEVVRTGAQLRASGLHSCGCKIGESNKTHGMSGERLYGIWFDMKRRCKDPQNKRYKRYGGRGITVCPEWRDSFEAFRDWSMANGYQDDLTIDRIDPDGPYSPENCRWATIKEQNNNRSNNRYITCNGKTLTLSGWSELTGLHRTTITRRMARGMSVEQSLGMEVDEKDANR